MSKASDFKEYAYREADEVFESLRALYDSGQIDTFFERFHHLPKYEQSLIYLKMEESQRYDLVQELTYQEVADFFDSIEFYENNYQELLHPLSKEEGAQVINMMQYDNAASLLSAMPIKLRHEYLAHLTSAERAQLLKLAAYDEHTAGSLMTTEYISLYSEMTVRQTLDYLKELAPDSETIYYLFVVNDQGQLVGVVSLRDLIIAEESDTIGNIMRSRVIAVEDTEDQEAVAFTMQDYDFLSLPVVDENRHLLGVITADDIMDVIQAEAEEDYYHLAGSGAKGSTYDESPLRTAKSRLPWLITLTFMGMATATMLSTFEDTLEKVALLGAFIPIIGGMAGNAGTQSLAVAVRGLATNEIKNHSFVRVALKDLLTGIVTGLICGSILFVIISLFFHEPMIGVVVAISLFVAMSFATLSGTFIPILMSKLKVDPAVASGPFITTINDIIGLLIYFLLANALLEALQ